MAGWRPSFWRAWTAALVLLILLFWAASQQRRFPFDLEITRTLQAWNPSGRAWAQYVTNSAKPPLSLGLLALASIAAWRMGGLRAVGIPSIAYAAVLALDPLLKRWIARPRPSADLVQVAGSTAGNGCPSTFALVYAATFGAVMLVAALRMRPPRRWWIVGGGVLILLVGGGARVVLGGHWPSDVLLSYALGALLLTGIARLLGVR